MDLEVLKWLGLVPQSPTPNPLDLPILPEVPTPEDLVLIPQSPAPNPLDLPILPQLIHNKALQIYHQII